MQQRFRLATEAMRLGNPVVDSQKTLAELGRPLSHGLVADDDAAGREHLLDRAPTQREAEIQPDGVADDFRRKPQAGVDRTSALAHAANYRSGSGRRKLTDANFTARSAAHV